MDLNEASKFVKQYKSLELKAKRLSLKALQTENREKLLQLTDLYYDIQNKLSLNKSKLDKALAILTAAGKIKQPRTRRRILPKRKY